MSSYKSLGGYLPLESSIPSQKYHKDAIQLNTGRNALEYVILSRNIKRIRLPYFFCDVMLEPLKRHNVQVEFYHVDENLEPILNNSFENEHILYINYFGIKGKTADSLEGKFKNLIIDNSQAFFKKKSSQSPCFYSCRKFLGVPDGAYVYCNSIDESSFERDISTSRLNHLKLQILEGVEAGYSDFKKNEEVLSNQPIRLMSHLTNKMLQNIDYNFIIQRRLDNYDILSKALSGTNLFQFPKADEDVPLSFPFSCENNDRLYSRLIDLKIYTPRYWPNILNNGNTSNIEKTMSRIIHLPLDQRYGPKEMKYLIEKVKSLI